MTVMTPAQIEAFLGDPRHAIAGTIRSDGSPQLSPVWYLYENGRVYISLLTDTAKYRNLRRDPRISVCIDGCHPDARAVMISGTVEFLAKGHRLEEEIRGQIIRRYHENEAEADRYAARTENWDFVLAIVNPFKVISQDFN